MLKTHGATALRSGRSLLRADYRPGDAGPGLLRLRLEDQETLESRDGDVRLDPWIGDEYPLIEFKAGNCFLLCGAQAVVAVDCSSLSWLSSVGLEYQEGETIDSPWHVEAEESQLLVVATERRVWCVNEVGAIRWIWSCSVSNQDAWIVGSPVVVGSRVRLPINTRVAASFVDLRLADGLP